MKMPRLKGFRFPPAIIAYAVWAYYCFSLSTADVENLLAERGVTVSRETIRWWVNRFGGHFSSCIRRERPGAADKWHLDEVFIPMNGRKFWLWGAVDANGDTLDILVQPRRNAKAARRFLKQLIAQFGEPRIVISGKLRSYFTSIRDLAPGADHRVHKGLNNRIEGSIDQLESAKSLWGASSRQDKRNDSLPLTTRSTPYFDPAAINSALSHTVPSEQMLLAYVTTTFSR